MSRCTAEAMNLYLTEIARAVASDAHAVLLLGQACWHMNKKFVIPATITLLPLPARSPELNPVENPRRSIPENGLGNRIFASYEGILNHCCNAWNKLIDKPWRIIPTGLCAWAHEFWTVRVVPVFDLGWRDWVQRQVLHGSAATTEAVRRAIQHR